MSGAAYVAVRRISNKANETLAAVGATCERVPVEALARLEARGAIKRKERPATLHGAEVVEGEKPARVGPRSRRATTTEGEE